MRFHDLICEDVAKEPRLTVIGVLERVPTRLPPKNKHIRIVLDESKNPLSDPYCKTAAFTSRSV
jgi:hypothetical protein